MLHAGMVSDMSAWLIGSWLQMCPRSRSALLGPLLPTTWSTVPLTSIGTRAFPVAGARIWNTLPLHVTSASSLTVFKQHIKLHLFCFSFPGLSPVWLLSGPCSVCCHLGHYTKILIDCNSSLCFSATEKSYLGRFSACNFTSNWIPTSTWSLSASALGWNLHFCTLVFLMCAINKFRYPNSRVLAVRRYKSSDVSPCSLPVNYSPRSTALDVHRFHSALHKNSLLAAACHSYWSGHSPLRRSAVTKVSSRDCGLKLP